MQPGMCVAASVPAHRDPPHICNNNECLHVTGCPRKERGKSVVLEPGAIVNPETGGVLAGREGQLCTTVLKGLCPAAEREEQPM